MTKEEMYMFIPTTIVGIIFGVVISIGNSRGVSKQKRIIRAIVSGLIWGLPVISTTISIVLLTCLFLYPIIKISEYLEVEE